MFEPHFGDLMLNDDCFKHVEVPKDTYISCIKIGGIPILPPLVTPEKRVEMQKYRAQAIEVERRIKTRIEQQKLTLALNKTLENSLAYESLALETCDDKKSEKNLVPSKTKPLQLSRNIFDVTEYNDNGLILFKDFDNVLLDEITPKRATTQPRLLRSNSYTLDSPSPVLMEHFKKHYSARKELNDSDCQLQDSLFTSTSTNSSTTLASLQSATNFCLTKETFTGIISDLAEVHFGNKDGGQSSKNYVCPSLPHTGQQLHNIQGEQIDTSDHLDSSSVLLIDFESETGENLTFCCDDTLSKVSILDSDVCYSSPPSTADKEKRPCSRVLFTSSPKFDPRIREEWAATVLTAAVRGYLIRRLKRTERVQNLIQIIHDILILAINLHSEKPDLLQPRDIELHERLIKQITAACYEFHDIFFKLSVKEKMEIIALDRQKQKEKASKLLSSRSSSSRKSSISSTRQKKALVSTMVG